MYMYVKFVSCSSTIGSMNLESYLKKLAQPCKKFSFKTEKLHRKLFGLANLRIGNSRFGNSRFGLSNKCTENSRLGNSTPGLPNIES